MAATEVPSAAPFLSERVAAVAEEANGNIPPFAALRVPPTPPPRCWWCLSAAVMSTAFSLSSMAEKES